MSRFSDVTESVLRKAGWYEGRQTDLLDRFLQSLKGQGYPIHRGVVDFLREFGGLEIVIELRGYGPCVKDVTLHIDPVLVSEHVDPDWVQYSYNVGGGVPLCPVAVEEKGAGSHWMLDATSRVFAASEGSWMICVAPNPDAALEAFCQHKKDFTQVDLPREGITPEECRRLEEQTRLPSRRRRGGNRAESRPKWWRFWR